MPLGADTAVDYRSRLRRLEQALDMPLENAPAMVLRTLASTLKNDPRVVGVIPDKFIGDVAVALRAYAGFLDVWDGESRQSLLPTSVLVAELSALGFSQSAPSHAAFARLQRQNIVLYVGMASVVVHPGFEACYGTLSDGQRTIRYCHHADLLDFPEQDTGEGPIHYGIRFQFSTADSLRRFSDRLQTVLAEPSPVVPGATVGDDIGAADTETSAIVKARIGQGRFRADLLHYWQGRCAITGIGNPELLRASHIKPWSISTNAERLDPFNGLLLAVHLDALFDRTLITFQDSGEMHVSGRMTSLERAVFGLAEPSRKLLLTTSHLGYMRHHRNRFEIAERGAP